MEAGMRLQGPVVVLAVVAVAVAVAVAVQAARQSGWMQGKMLLVVAEGTVVREEKRVARSQSMHGFLTMLAPYMLTAGQVPMERMGETGTASQSLSKRRAMGVLVAVAVEQAVAEAMEAQLQLHTRLY